jgi:hypothetical protein
VARRTRTARRTQPDRPRATRKTQREPQEAETLLSGLLQPTMWPLRCEVARLERRRSERVGIASHEHREAISASTRRRSSSVRPTPRMMLSSSLRIAPWGSAAISRASSCARSSAPPCGTISLTRPMRCASSTPIRRPVITSSIALANPTTSGSRTVMPSRRRCSIAAQARRTRHFRPRWLHILLRHGVAKYHGEPPSDASPSSVSARSRSK